MKKLATVSDVIAELGGPTKTAALVDKTAQHANGWRIAGKFPARTFIAINSALSERGCEAPPSLWGMVEPEVTS